LKITIVDRISDLFRCFGGTASITLVKAVNAAGSVNELLLTGEKRVTSRTNFDVEILAHC